MASILKVDQIQSLNDTAVVFKTGTATNYLAPTYIGQLTSFRVRRVTSADFPFWNLSLPDQTLQSTNYPDYVTYLRSIKVEINTPTLIGTSVTCSGTTVTTPSTTLAAGTIIYFHTLNQFRIILSGSGTSYTIDEPLTASAQSCSSINQSIWTSAFTGTWSTTTITLNDEAQNRILLDALAEDAYYQGASFNSGTGLITPINSSNWMILRWGTTDTTIASLNPSTRQITVSSGTPSGTFEIYPHRTLLTTEARHKQVDDSVLINNGMQVVNGLRLRDRMQGHKIQVNNIGAGTQTTFQSGSILYNTGGGIIQDTTIITDGINGNPRTGQFTRPRGLGVYYYEYVGKVL